MKFKQPLEDETLDEEFEAEPIEIIDDIGDIDEDGDDEIAEPAPPAAGPLVLAAPARRDVTTLDPLHIYLQEIKKFRALEPDEEFDLARRYRDEKEEQAAFILITSNLRLVVKIAMDFQRRWMKNVLDLIQEGNVGLMKAVQKFDPDKGIKFSYYASFWIKAYILKFIMDNWRMVKIGTTQAQRKLFYNLGKERQRLQAQGFDPSASRLSESLNVSESDILEMEQRLSGNDLSLDVSLGGFLGHARGFPAGPDPGIEDMLADEEISAQLESTSGPSAPTFRTRSAIFWKTASCRTRP
jgi:RNA polymerase sigma-32 factor